MAAEKKKTNKSKTANKLTNNCNRFNDSNVFVDEYAVENLEKVDKLDKPAKTVGILS